MSILEKQTRKISTSTVEISVYLLFYLLYLYTHEFEHGGPCSPGLDFMLALLFPFLTLTITIVTGTLQTKDNRYILPFVISLIISLATLIFILKMIL